MTRFSATSTISAMTTDTVSDLMGQFLITPLLSDLTWEQKDTCQCSLDATLFVSTKVSFCFHVESLSG